MEILAEGECHLLAIFSPFPFTQYPSTPRFFGLVGEDNYVNDTKNKLHVTVRLRDCTCISTLLFHLRACVRGKKDDCSQSS